MSNTSEIAKHAVMLNALKGAATITSAIDVIFYKDPKGREKALRDICYLLEDLQAKLGMPNKLGKGEEARELAADIFIAAKNERARDPKMKEKIEEIWRAISSETD